MNPKLEQKLSRFMCRVLRHTPGEIGIKLDLGGWTDLNTLIKKLNMSGYIIILDDILGLVERDEKKRYAFSEDMTKIRCVQGHSVNVNLGLTPTFPPTILYQGTATKSINAIKEKGLKPMSRQYVHLTADPMTAIEVGKRHGKPVLLVIKSNTMYLDGCHFFLSENNVWLTKEVPIQYIDIINAGDMALYINQHEQFQKSLTKSE